MPSHLIKLARSGRTLECAPDEPVLDAAFKKNILIPYGCRNGACGSCRAKLNSGAIEYPGGPPAGIDAVQRARGEILLCQAHPRSDLELEVEELDAERVTAVRTLPVRVVGLEQVAHDVMRMSLKLPAAERLQYLAGQYVEILLRDGRRRAFSLANAPHQDEVLQLHIRHVPGGAFSGYVFDSMRERALLRIHGPLGGFYLREDSDRPVVLVAGGTGLAPIRAMVEASLHAGHTRPMALFWGVRARRDLYLHDEAQRWARHPHIEYLPVLSEPAADGSLEDDDWSGHTGFVHQAVLEHVPHLLNTDVYASGPPVMVKALREALAQRDFDLDRLFYDSFDYAFETGYDG